MAVPARMIILRQKACRFCIGNNLINSLDRMNSGEGDKFGLVFILCIEIEMISAGCRPRNVGLVTIKLTRGYGEKVFLGEVVMRNYNAVVGKGNRIRWTVRVVKSVSSVARMAV